MCVCVCVCKIGHAHSMWKSPRPWIKHMPQRGQHQILNHYVARELLKDLYIENNRTLEFPGHLVAKDPALSLLWLGFDPWSMGSSHDTGVAKGKKKTTTKKNKNKKTERKEGKQKDKQS